jgi:hypothetical protein
MQGYRDRWPTIESMASYDGLPLRLETAGGIILLSLKSRRDWLEHFPDGVEVRVGNNSRGIRIGGIDPSCSIDELGTIVRDYANKALDLMAVRSIGSHALVDQSSPFICWRGHPILLYALLAKPTLLSR